MKIEKRLLIFLLVILAIGILLPVLIFILIKDKVLAAQIGDTLGGTSAPFVNISAILVVIITYLYQKRNDKKNYERELIFELFNNIKNEFEKILLSETSGPTNNRKTEDLQGKWALLKIIEYMNNNYVSNAEIVKWDSYKAMMNVYQSIDNLLELIQKNESLTKYEQELFTSQISLFYRNNLFLELHERGDIYCEYHKTTHEIPKGFHDIIKKIDAKIT